MLPESNHIWIEGAWEKKTTGDSGVWYFRREDKCKKCGCIKVVVKGSKNDEAYVRVACYEKNGTVSNIDLGCK